MLAFRALSALTTAIRPSIITVAHTAPVFLHVRNKVKLAGPAISAAGKIRTGQVSLIEAPLPKYRDGINEEALKSSGASEELQRVFDLTNANQPEINRARRAFLIEQLQRHKNDVGSSEVQIGLMTAQLKAMENHFKRYPNDVHNMRNYNLLWAKRRRLMLYLKRTSFQRYQELVNKLHLPMALDFDKLYYKKSQEKEKEKREKQAKMRAKMKRK
eukprot:Colp12_sorted_trinity150504_noHs@19165